jgi:hypothetical protein
MKVRRLLAGATLALLLSAVSYFANQNQPTALKLARTTQDFLTELTAEQRKKAEFAFDDAERLNWHFIPLEDKPTRKSTRKGVGLFELNEAQKKAARNVVQAALSEEGSQTALTIMSLEEILNDLEKGKGFTRNSGWYFFSVFGKPEATGRWALRIEGHHLSLHFTMENGSLVSATPAFYGANPAIVKHGDRKGLVTIKGAEPLARDLIASLTEEQRKMALQDKMLPEVEAKNKAPSSQPPIGVAGSNLNAKQKDGLKALIQSYANRLPTVVAEDELKAINEAGIDKVQFAYSGTAKEAEGYAYRIEGPTFRVEFINEQADSAGNKANHIHSAWRSKRGKDFGQDLKN